MSSFLFTFDAIKHTTIMKKLFLLIVLCFVGAYSYGSCTPTFANPCSTYPFNVSIRSLIGTAGSISDVSACTSSSYESMTSLSCTLNPGATYSTTLNVTTSYYNSMQMQIWIDFDNDGTFASSETIGGGGYFSSATPTIAITVPGSAAAGTHIMRLVANYNCCGGSTYPTINPCPTTAISYGDARDYTVSIASGSPYGTIAPTALSFGAVASGATSSPLSCVFNGYYLTPATGTLTVTAPSNFEVSPTAGGTYTSSYTIGYSGGVVSATSVYARFVAPGSTGTSTGTICVTGGGLSPVCATVSGTSMAPCSGTPSAGTVSASSTTACGSTPVVLTVAGYTSAVGIGFQWESSPTGSSWTAISGETNATLTTTMSASTYYRCGVTCSYSGATAYTSSVLITYTSSCTTLTASPSTLPFSGVYAGTTSSWLNTVVSGTYLSPSTGSVTVTAPTNFEVCNTSGGTYASSFTIAYSGATISASSVFIRFVAPAVTGTYSGNVTISGGGATPATVAVSGISLCSGTPSGGASAATTTSSCGSTSVTLTNTGHTTGADISLQWEESTTGSGGWTSITGATNATYTFTGAAVTMYYHVVVTCISSGSSSTSTSASVAVDRINGHIAFTSAAPDTLDMKVWLIYHNTSAGTLTAIDSIISCVDGVLPYYEFNGMGTGNYLVKARALDYTSTIIGASGFVPTYGASNAHWDTAVTVTHTAGATDSMHIDMVSGIVPAGPGFIGGYISSGAGKNTAGDVPAVHMIVFLMDASRHVLTYTYTDGSGNYAFSGIGYGNYIIYPEDIMYTTTPSSLVTLTSSAASATGMNFKQRTGSKTITPNMSTVIKSVTHMGNDCVLFPNPASNELTINMDENAFSSLTITNNVGATVLSSQVNKSLTVLNIKDLTPGVYFIKLTGTAGTVVKQFVKM